ncbi:hypothetical protein [Desulfitibacter alkalitolerans]|uniref:hypothetical protein n=1 Tax=Desulfitibacter alkalitolerans TaxID=264641 RepID=UPI000481E562|nr:hypothetical protein [Desulfitibacter alkalitolerans]
MTIIMTVVVPDGIVVAGESRAITADSLTSIESFSQKEHFIPYEVHSDNSNKIYKIGNFGLAYSGPCFDMDGWSIRQDIAELERAFSKNTIEEVAAGFVQKLTKALPAKTGYGFQLSGYNNEGLPKTFNYDDGQFKQSPGYYQGRMRYGLMMNGETTLINKLFDGEKILFHAMSLRDAIEFAELSITVGYRYLQFFKEYQPVSNGPVDILVITPNTSRFVKHKALSLLGKESIS